MGRKKIQISRIGDERNRQVGTKVDVGGGESGFGECFRAQNTWVQHVAEYLHALS